MPTRFAHFLVTGLCLLLCGCTVEQPEPEPDVMDMSDAPSDGNALDVEDAELSDAQVEARLAEYCDVSSGAELDREMCPDLPAGAWCEIEDPGDQCDTCLDPTLENCVPQSTLWTCTCRENIHGIKRFSCGFYCP